MATADSTTSKGSAARRTAGGRSSSAARTSPARTSRAKARTSPARTPRAKVSTAARTRTPATAGQAKTAQAKTLRAKAARTRTVHGAERTAGDAKATLRQAQQATRSTADVVGDYAERAVLIPVGAALLARERVLSSVNDAISTYSSPARTQLQLRRFERRGTTARNRLEREVRKTRLRVERELRQNRRELQRRVNDLDKRRSNVASDLESTVQSRLQDGADLANRLGERVLSLL